MRKWIILVVILGVLGGAVALALMNLNSYLNRNRDWLAGQVEGSLGRKVSFSEIGVSIFGGFGARIKDLHVADDAAFSKEDFVRAGDVQVSVELWPALFGTYRVKRVVLVKPEVTIIRTKEGFNYESMTKAKGGAEKPAEASGAATPAPVAPAAPPSAGEKAAFLVSLIDLKDGEFRYVDRTTSPPSDFSIHDLDFSASDVSLDHPIHLKLATALFGEAKQNLSVDGSLGPLGSPPNVQQAPLDLDLKIGPLVIDNLRKLEALAKALPPELSSPDPISLEAKLAGTVNKLKLDGRFDGTGAAIRYGSSFQKPKGVTMKLDLNAEREGNALDVKSLAVRLAELDLTGKGTVDSSPGGALDFQIDSKKTPLSGWDRMLPAFAGHEVSGTVEVHVRAKGKTGSGQPPPDLSGTVSLENVSAKQKGSPYEIDGLTTRIDLKGNSATVPPTDFKLSGSPVHVEAQVASFRPALAANFSLKSPELSAASLNFASPQAKKAEVLRGLEIHGQFRAGEGSPTFQGTVHSTDGSLRDFDYRELAADLALRDQVAILDKLALRAFDGTYSGSGRYDMHQGDNPKFDFRSTVRDMDLKTLLATESPGTEKKIEGKLDADLSLAGSGKVWEAIKKQLRGDGRIDVRNGVLKDVNLADQVLTSVTGIAGLSNLISPRVRGKYPELFSTGDTKFDKLGGSVRIADGVARSDDLTLAARDYAMLGKGTCSLDNELDFVATFVASKQLSDDIIADVREVKYIANEQGKIEIPFRLTGALPKVRPKPDGEFIAKALQRAVVSKGIEKLLGKEKPVPPGTTPVPDTKHPERELLKKGLEGLLGR